MRITFQVDGGFAVFPGLSRPVSFDVDDLPCTEAIALRSVVARSDFFARDDSSASPFTGIADVRRYVVTIESGIERRSLVIRETIEEPQLRQLLRLLDDARRSLRSSPR